MNAWRVQAYTGKNGDKKLGESFVRADTEQEAKATGRAALRLIGVKGRFVVYAKRYCPTKDYHFHGYIRILS
jgi:hypothetical protein